MDNANPELESGDESDGDTFRGQNADSGIDGKLNYTSMKQAPMSNTDFSTRAD